MFSDRENEAVEILREANIDGTDGLPENLFLLVSSLVPLPNIDLLIVNEKNEILLSRRNDEFFQKSWHIPGGCMRIGEDFDRRIKETSKRELGCVVEYDAEPISVRNVVREKKPSLKHPNERGHNVAILFKCKLPSGYIINNKGLNESDNGYLKWFNKLPEDFMKIQYVYGKILDPWL